MRRSVTVKGKTIEYTLIKTQRSSVELRVIPGEVRLFAPPSLPLRRADDMVRERADWIEEAQRRFDAYHAAEREAFPMTDGMPVPVQGKTYTLRVRKSGAARATFDGDQIVIEGPDPSPDGVSEALRACLIRRAQEVIHERLDYYIPLIGRSPGRVTLREQKTKWGSCSAQGNLNFNWKLIMAPAEALDYVVIHELCHLYEFNHSPAFWARVARYQPEYAVWRDFLRSGWKHPYS